MAKIVSKIPQTKQMYVGIQSNGSDRTIVPYTVWIVTLLDDNNIQSIIQFDHNPSNAEIYASLSQAVDIDPITKSDWDSALKNKYLDWRRWHNTHAEAVSRGVAAVAITAILSRRDQAWSAYLTALNSWRLAT